MNYSPSFNNSGISFRNNNEKTNLNSSESFDQKKNITFSKILNKKLLI